MSSCPRNEHGHPLCYVVDHPDRPFESFCSTCQRRFRKEDFTWGALPVIAILVVALTMVIGRLTNVNSQFPEPVQDVVPPVPAVVPTAVPTVVITMPASEDVGVPSNAG